MILVTGGAPTGRAAEPRLLIVGTQILITGEFGGVQPVQPVQTGVDGRERAVHDRSGARTAATLFRRATTWNHDSGGGGRGRRGELFAVGCSDRCSKSGYATPQARVGESQTPIGPNVSVASLRSSGPSTPAPGVNPEGAAYGASVLVLPDASLDAVRANPSPAPRWVSRD
jgi:hypothetical protein